MSASSNKKLKELILYIADKLETAPNFGLTVLNKILFFADFTTFGNTSNSITGQKYLKFPRGPILSDLPFVLEELKKSGECAIKSRSYYGYPQKRVIAFREADLSSFSGLEIAIVDKVIEELQDFCATDVSELSHKFPGWQFAEDGEEIPYYTVFISNRELSQEEFNYGREVEVGR